MSKVIALAGTLKSTESGVTVDAVPAFSLSISAAERSSPIMSLASLATDQAVPFGSIAKATLLYINPDGELTMKLNGGVQAIAIGPGPCVLYSSTTGYSAMTLSNAGASAVTVEIGIWGA